MENFCVRVYRNGSICLPSMLLHPPTPVVMSNPPLLPTSSPHYLIVVLCGPALPTPAVIHCHHQSRAIAAALLPRCRHRCPWRRGRGQGRRRWQRGWPVVIGIFAVGIVAVILTIPHACRIEWTHGGGLNPPQMMWFSSVLHTLSRVFV